MLISKQSIFLSMQLLWINMVTDSLPAIALGMEAVPDSVMLAKPKPRNEGIFARGFGLRIILQGLMFGALAIIAFYIGENTMHVENAGRTLAFMVLACSQTVQAYNMRSEQSLFKIGVFSNKHLNYAALFSLVMMALVLFVQCHERIQYDLSDGRTVSDRYRSDLRSSRCDGMLESVRPDPP